MAYSALFCALQAGGQAIRIVSADFFHLNSSWCGKEIERDASKVSSISTNFTLSIKGVQKYDTIWLKLKLARQPQNH